MLRIRRCGVGIVKSFHVVHAHNARFFTRRRRAVFWSSRLNLERSLSL